MVSLAKGWWPITGNQRWQKVVPVATLRDKYRSVRTAILLKIVSEISDEVKFNNKYSNNITVNI